MAKKMTYISFADPENETGAFARQADAITRFDKLLRGSLTNLNQLASRFFPETTFSLPSNSKPMGLAQVSCHSKYAAFGTTGLQAKAYILFGRVQVTIQAKISGSALAKINHRAKSNSTPLESYVTFARVGQDMLVNCIEIVLGRPNDFSNAYIAQITDTLSFVECALARPND
jgi:hypothetical protein